jgi:hypothetical protein
VEARDGLEMRKYYTRQNRRTRAQWVMAMSQRQRGAQDGELNQDNYNTIYYYRVSRAQVLDAWKAKGECILLLEYEARKGRRGPLGLTSLIYMMG